MVKKELEKLKHLNGELKHSVGASILKDTHAERLHELT